MTDQPDTSCRKCGAPATKPNLPRAGIFSQATFTLTGFLCKCGHWNNFKNRCKRSKKKAIKETRQTSPVTR